MPAREFEPKVLLRYHDYEKRSREPDACGPRDPGESALIIILPVTRIDRKGATHAVA